MQFMAPATTTRGVHWQQLHFVVMLVVGSFESEWFVQNIVEIIINC